MEKEYIPSRLALELSENIVVLCCNGGVNLSYEQKIGRVAEILQQIEQDAYDEGYCAGAGY